MFDRCLDRLKTNLRGHSEDIQELFGDYLRESLESFPGRFSQPPGAVNNLPPVIKLQSRSTVADLKALQALR